MKLARRLCPDAIIVRGDYDRYSYYSDMVTEIISERVPLYEKSSIDEFYIDLTGMDRFLDAIAGQPNCDTESQKKQDCRFHLVYHRTKRFQKSLPVKPNPTGR